MGSAQNTFRIATGETSIFGQASGSGPPLLLLHGFPQTRLMWRSVLPFLEEEFTVVCPDLRGYGDSGCAVSSLDHAPYSKRAMALDMVTVMERLGFRRFSVAGHDRGGRVAYRMALDHAQHVEQARRTRRSANRCSRSTVAAARYSSQMTCAWSGFASDST